MAKIHNAAPGCWSAHFNNRNIIIRQDHGALQVVDTETGEVIAGAELRSVRNLFDWHIRSGRMSSELPVIATTRLERAL